MTINTLLIARQVERGRKDRPTIYKSREKRIGGEAKFCESVQSIRGWSVKYRPIWRVGKRGVSRGKDREARGGRRSRRHRGGRRGDEPNRHYTKLDELYHREKPKN